MEVNTVIIVKQGMVQEVYSDAWHNNIEIVDLDSTDFLEYSLAKERADEISTNPEFVQVY